jgi:hypothetical protein
METSSYGVAWKQPGPSNEGSPDYERQRILIESLAVWDSIFPGADKRDLELIAVAYAKVLGRVSPEQLARACSLVLERSRFFPTPAEILELAGEPLVQGLELEAQRAWVGLLDDVEEWASYRDAKGEPLPRKRTIRTKPASPDCSQCEGTEWAHVDPRDRAQGVFPCPCTGPRQEGSPQLPSATLYALSRLGGYRALSEDLYGERASWLQREFVAAYVYFQKTGGLKHLPAAKTDAALLGEIERKSGIRLLKR